MTSCVVGRVEKERGKTICEKEKGNTLKEA